MECFGVFGAVLDFCFCKCCSVMFPSCLICDSEALLCASFIPKYTGTGGGCGFEAEDVGTGVEVPASFSGEVLLMLAVC